MNDLVLTPLSRIVDVLDYYACLNCGVSLN